MLRFARVALVPAMIAAVVGGDRPLGAQRASSISPALFAGLSWRCIGPFDGGPVASVTGVAGQPGVYVITTPSGGAWKTTDAGDTWAPIDRQSVPAAASDPHRWIDPANPRRIVRTDAQGIEVSLDGGQAWRASHQLPIAEVAHLTPRARAAEPAGRRQVDGTPSTVSIVDPARPGFVFAGTTAGVYVSFDDGSRWLPLTLNMPPVVINDLDIRGSDLVAATHGRSTWQLDDISPLRALNEATASAPAILFQVAAATLPSFVNLDYSLGASTRGDVTIEIADAAGRVVHTATSAAPDPTDRWLPVARPLPATPGHHRVVWNLRFDPPPAEKHRYAQMARAAFEELPPEPDGPRVLAGTYRVKLTAAGQAYSQLLVVRDDPRATPATRAAAKRELDLALTIYDAMQAAHRAFMQVAHVRAQVAPLLTSNDADVAAMATALDARLVQVDGTDWTGLIIPDADDDSMDPDEAEEQGIKHPDFVPPKPVSVSKDYDDPTSILGRVFENVNHAPALTPLSADLGTMLTRAIKTPDVVAAADYDRTCRQLASVLDAWRVMNTEELARVNAQLATLKLPALPTTASVPAIVCR